MGLSDDQIQELTHGDIKEALKPKRKQPPRGDRRGCPKRAKLVPAAVVQKRRAGGGGRGGVAPQLQIRTTTVDQLRLNDAKERRITMGAKRASF